MTLSKSDKTSKKIKDKTHETKGMTLSQAIVHVLRVKNKDKRYKCVRE